MQITYGALESFAAWAGYESPQAARAELESLILSSRATGKYLRNGAEERRTGTVYAGPIRRKTRLEITVLDGVVVRVRNKGQHDRSISSDRRFR